MYIFIPLNDLELLNDIRRSNDIPEIVFKVQDILKRYSHCYYHFYLYYERHDPTTDFVIFKIADEGNHCFVTKILQSFVLKEYRGEIGDIVRETVRSSIIELSLSKLKEQTKE